MHRRSMHRSLDAAENDCHPKEMLESQTVATDQRAAPGGTYVHERCLTRNLSPFALGRAGPVSQSHMAALAVKSSAPSCGIGLCQIGSLEFQRIEHLFDLDDSHVLIHSLIGGLIDNN